MPILPQMDFATPIVGAMDRMIQTEIGRRQRQAETETNMAQARYLRSTNDKLDELRKSGTREEDWAEVMRKHMEDTLESEAQNISLKEYQDVFRSKLFLQSEAQIQSLRAEEKAYKLQLTESDFTKEAMDAIARGDDPAKAWDIARSAAGMDNIMAPGTPSQSFIELYDGDVSKAQIAYDTYQGKVYAGIEAEGFKKLAESNLSAADALKEIGNRKAWMEGNLPNLPPAAHAMLSETVAQGEAMVIKAYTERGKNATDKIFQDYLDNYHSDKQAGRNNVGVVEAVFKEQMNSPIPEVREHAADRMKELFLYSTGERARAASGGARLLPGLEAWVDDKVYRRIRGGEGDVTGVLLAIFRENGWIDRAGNPKSPELAELYSSMVTKHRTKETFIRENGEGIAAMVRDRLGKETHLQETVEAKLSFILANSKDITGYNNQYVDKNNHVISSEKMTQLIDNVVAETREDTVKGMFIDWWKDEVDEGDKEDWFKKSRSGWLVGRINMEDNPDNSAYMEAMKMQRYVLDDLKKQGITFDPGTAVIDTTTHDRAGSPIFTVAPRKAGDSHIALRVTTTEDGKTYMFDKIPVEVTQIPGSDKFEYRYQYGQSETVPMSYVKSLFPGIGGTSAVIRRPGNQQ